MRDLKFTFNESDNLEAVADAIYNTNRNANLDGIEFEYIYIKSTCSKERNNALIEAIKSKDGGITSSICEIVRSFY